jgi:hypothetical protein
MIYIFSDLNQSFYFDNCLAVRKRDIVNQSINGRYPTLHRPMHHQQPYQHQLKFSHEYWPLPLKTRDILLDLQVLGQLPDDTPSAQTPARRQTGILHLR